MLGHRLNNFFRVQSIVSTAVDGPFVLGEPIIWVQASFSKRNLEFAEHDGILTTVPELEPTYRDIAERATAANTDAQEKDYGRQANTVAVINPQTNTCHDCGGQTEDY
jgi:alkanesulfonate monooxygenase SsuD/methylene tetrahydromethanopterin reductase-like flavin-dependent oxidoreductase (luciferase family)